MVGEVPPGATRLGLLACPEASDCVEEARWYADHPLAASLPTLFFAEALADPGDVQARALETRATFEWAVAEARDRVRAGKPAADALRVAEGALIACTGVVAQQVLFDLYFLHGAEALRSGGADSTDWFTRAAAVAWTQQIVLPVDAWRVVDGWKAGQHAALHARRSKLTLVEAPEGATWAIDGVDLGAGARAIEVFPGPHRLTATIPGRARTFVQLVTLGAGENRSVAAAFPPEVDLSTVHGAVAATVSGTPLDADTRAALEAWASQRGLAELVVVWIDGDPRRLCTLALAPGTEPRLEGCGASR